MFVLAALRDVFDHGADDEMREEPRPAALLRILVYPRIQSRSPDRRWQVPCGSSSALESLGGAARTFHLETFRTSRRAERVMVTMQVEACGSRYLDPLIHIGGGVAGRNERKRSVMTVTLSANCRWCEGSYLLSGFISEYARRRIPQQGALSCSPHSVCEYNFYAFSVF